MLRVSWRCLRKTGEIATFEFLNILIDLMQLFCQANGPTFNDLLSGFIMTLFKAYERHLRIERTFVIVSNIYFAGQNINHFLC